LPFLQTAPLCSPFQLAAITPLLWMQHVLPPFVCQYAQAVQSAKTGLTSRRKPVMKIMAILGSSRKKGNTEFLVDQILKGIDSTRIYLADHHLAPLVDKRHTEEGFRFGENDCDEIMRKFLESDVIIFATPLYWYGMSGQMKIFFDRWSQYLRDPRFGFREELGKKQAYVVIAGGDDPKTEALPLLQQFTLIFRYVKMDFVDYLIAKGNRPGDVKQDKAALAKAALWNQTLLGP
jgi:multimeric flavodoxin WrbA